IDDRLRVVAAGGPEANAAGIPVFRKRHWITLLARAAQVCLQTCVHVRLGRRPTRDADAHRGPTVPDRPAAPARAIPLHRLADVPRVVVAAERYLPLIQY